MRPQKLRIIFGFLTMVISIMLVVNTTRSQSISLLPAKTSFPCQAVSFPIVASGFPSLTYIDLTLYIEIDPNVLTYTGYTNGTLIPTVGIYGNNIIGVTWTWASTFTLSGTLLTLNFTYHGGYDTLHFYSCSLNAGNPPAPVSVTYSDGLIGRCRRRFTTSTGPWPAVEMVCRKEPPWKRSMKLQTNPWSLGIKC